MLKDTQQLKTLFKYDNKECLDLSFVKFSPYRIINVNNSRRVDTLLGYWVDKPPLFKKYDEFLYEYLQQFLDKIQSPARRKTLVVFKYSLSANIKDILGKLRKKNVDVILVSPGFIFNLPIIPNHLQLLNRPSSSEPLNVIYEQLVDVIKKPEFNRFEFNNYLPKSKR